MKAEQFPVGIIGLGPLGMTFAEQLMGQGLPVIGYRRSGMEEFVAAGGIAAASPADLVERSEIVLDCLPHEDALMAICDGPLSIMDSVRPGQIVATLASHSMEGKQRLADLVAAMGGVVLDCIVDGTMEMAAAREATIYVSGDPDASGKAASLIDRLTEHQIHIGSFGNATRMRQAGKSS
jgi:3-hydroxyisobutyrate dehydrogenase-like beta-hydroxyacid dehydrogenase